MSVVAVSSSFDDLRSRDVRFLEEAAKLGDLQVLLWSDDAIRYLEGREARFPQAEREYVVRAMRYVRDLTIVRGPFQRDTLPLSSGIQPHVWAVDESADSAAKRRFCEAKGIAYRVISDAVIRRFPQWAGAKTPEPSGRRKVIVTGCFDWFHSGHVRFFEEVAGLGDLYVVVGHDPNIKHLKGEGHPMFPQDERRYLVGSVRHVKEAWISSGRGWLDAEPEMAVLRPDVYAVNRDGDVPEKREFCRAHGIEYVVLERTPKEGLPRRQSTALRGF